MLAAIEQITAALEGLPTGATDLADGTLLCSHHHHRAHDPTYRVHVHPDGDLTFHRRA